MIVVLLNVYLVILFVLVKLKVVQFNLFWKISPVIVFLALMIGLFIPMNWGAPQGAALVIRQSVPIVPDVAGEVIEVPAVANAPLKAGDVLFRIDPVPYQSQVGALEAQRRRVHEDGWVAGVDEGGLNGANARHFDDIDHVTAREHGSPFAVFIGSRVQKFELDLSRREGHPVEFEVTDLLDLAVAFGLDLAVLERDQAAQRVFVQAQLFTHETNSLAAFRSRHLPPLSGGVVATGFAIAILLALISGLPPALRARRLQIIESLADR